MTRINYDVALEEIRLIKINLNDVEIMITKGYAKTENRANASGLLQDIAHKCQTLGTEIIRS